LWCELAALLFQIKKINPQLSSKTARAMLTWAHFRFKQHLLHKIREYPWCRVVLVNEAYTSKTCTECGHVKTTKFRRHDTFECDACPYSGLERRPRHLAALPHRVGRRSLRADEGSGGRLTNNKRREQRRPTAIRPPDFGAYTPRPTAADRWDAAE
jgi:predicted RNA-binding Zn-ribbon protein involved in translation (DUF1610 family)